METSASRWVDRLDRRAFAGLVAGIAVAAGVITFVLGSWVFANGAVNLDELDYRNQASALRHGELTLDADTHVPSFRPYLTGIEDGEVIFTHQPLWPAAMAVVGAMGLPERTASAVAAGSAILAFSLFALEITRDRRTTLIAVGILSVSPLFLLQSGTLLAYTPTFALAFAALGLLLRSLRTGSRATAIAAGLAGGLLLFNRPYDAVLLGVATGAVLLLGPRRPQLRRGLAPFSLGLAPGVALLLLYNQMVMGSPFQFPYTIHPNDTIGFGGRASFEAGSPRLIPFGWGEASAALGRQLWQVPRFTAGGLILVGLALAGTLLRPRTWSTALLVGLLVAFPVGYFFWWTTWNTSNFGLHEFLGPAYYYPSVGALIVLAAIALRRLLDRSLPAAVGLVAVGLVFTGVYLDGLIQLNHDDVASHHRVADLSQAVDATPRLVFTPRTYAYDPYVHLFNDADLGGPVLYALDLRAANATAMADMPDRRAYRVWEEAERDGLLDPRVLRITELERHEVGPGEDLELVVRFDPPHGETQVFAYAGTEGGDDLVGPVTDCDPVCEVRWRVTNDGLAGPGGRVPLPDDAAQLITLGFGMGTDPTDVADRYAVRIPVARTGESLVVVTPPESWHQYAFPDGKRPWTPEDLDGVLELETNDP